jgi:octaprenyl-diphosphate synthase
MLLTTLKQTVNTDLNKVDKLIADSLHSEIDLVQKLSKYIIHGGGKRLRPLIVLLSAKACGNIGSDQITMAAVIEFIHTATLLHDDVVDDSMLRRGRETANNLWGNEAAVLVGDFLYSRAFQLMVGVQNLEVLKIIANATNTIAEGEVLQLLNQHNPETTEQNYLHVIRSKTAKLFESAAEIGAVLANSKPYIKSIVAQYGLHLGTAYQLIDDLLDYQLDNTNIQFGKPLGNDLAEGKPTMPLIYLFKHGTAAHRSLVTEAITKPQSVALATMQQAILESGALNYTLDFAKREAELAKQAISELPISESRTSLLELIDFVVTRTH